MRSQAYRTSIRQLLRFTDDLGSLSILRDRFDHVEPISKEPDWRRGCSTRLDQSQVAGTDLQID